MPWPRALVGLYSLFNIAVGLQAFLATGSVVSLVAGAGVGALLLACFFLIPKMPRIGYISATVVSVLVALRFLPGGFGEGAKIWPNLILGILALAVVALLTMAHFLARSHAKSGPAA